MESSTIDIELDDSVKNIKRFSKIKQIDICKMDIFKYGILNESVPKKIKENEFEYLESKIPYLFGLYQDYIDLDTKRIICLADEEQAKRISEIIGVGVGLFYAVQLLKITPNLIQRIPVPKDKKGKYLDFKIIKGKKQYEIETKGTKHHSKKNQFLDDIKAKKQNSTKTAVKCGVITLANDENEKKDSKIIVCDDMNDHVNDNEMTIYDYIRYYQFFLSFILDSSYYNRLVKRLDKRILKKNMIREEKIREKYFFKGKEYLGQYFDKRLILDLIAEYYEKDISLNRLFSNLTKEVGKQQFFLGIDKQLIKLLNSKDIGKLKDYFKPRIIEYEDGKKVIRDSDGILFVYSEEGSDSQISKHLDETVVKKRLELIMGAINNTPHPCGAMCRSKEKEGKPCEKLTFRDHCYFHRD